MQNHHSHPSLSTHLSATVTLCCANEQMDPQTKMQCHCTSLNISTFLYSMDYVTLVMLMHKRTPCSFIQAPAPKPQHHPHRNVMGFLPPPPSLLLHPSLSFFHTHTHTMKYTQTHSARGTNHHRLFSGPVCEWDFFTGEEEEAGTAAFVGMQLLRQGNITIPFSFFPPIT